MPMEDAPILVLCDDAETANALVTRIAHMHADVVYAPNKLTALLRISQFQFAAAVLVRQADTDDVAATLRAKGVPFCILDTASSKPVAVESGQVVVCDMDLVVPTVRALVTREGGEIPSPG